ncbi:hypothetical protein [Xanthomonas citri]|nr:hypothetical protein [Xanthomonas citri]
MFGSFDQLAVCITIAHREPKKKLPPQRWAFLPPQRWAFILRIRRGHTA